MTGKNLGFGALKDIKPDTLDEPPIPDHKIDEIGDRAGFVSREPTQKIVRRKEAEPSANLNIRPPISTYNRFVAWAMENRLSYPEALKELMDRAKI
ncbi:hypothetical protein ELI44_32945 (plasmid) [Rhizobium ruizarguesonis]|uniref:hypothetical protein n=1 Tax=Rhizobium ruizarguesonis TaxID=2081791 RepID=UPI001030E3A1|nr:hypothetical protein [Rhizobium ruizarguesonis]TAU37810.1 hypothetical protein ELI42_33190 [Rhizobium ruizarguesonis]TAU51275.1 hypothetical protein ELI44_32945 [Rhizobium ruizarguesonis]